MQKSARNRSLLDLHSEESSKSKKNPDEPEAYWDHSRDMSMGGRLMDDSQRRKLISDAKGLGERFGTGKSGGYLWYAIYLLQGFIRCVSLFNFHSVTKSIRICVFLSLYNRVARFINRAQLPICIWIQKDIVIHLHIAFVKTFHLCAGTGKSTSLLHTVLPCKSTPTSALYISIDPNLDWLWIIMRHIFNYYRWSLSYPSP